MASPHRPRLTGLACVLALAACSEQQTPQRVTPIAPPDAVQDLGTVRVRYNALPSLSMNATAAQAYGIERGAGRALVVVVLRRMEAGQEQPLQGEVSGTATDLSGRRQPIAFRPVRTGDYVDHIGVVDVSAHDTLRFALQVSSDAGGGAVRFERSF